MPWNFTQVRQTHVRADQPQRGAEAAALRPVVEPRQVQVQALEREQEQAPAAFRLQTRLPVVEREPAAEQPAEYVHPEEPVAAADKPAYVEAVTLSVNATMTGEPVAEPQQRERVQEPGVRAAAETQLRVEPQLEVPQQVAMMVEVVLKSQRYPLAPRP